MNKISKALTATVGLLLFFVAAVAVDAQGPIRGGVLNGKAREMPRPEYTDDMRALELSGAVRVAVTIGVDGDIVSAELAAPENDDDPEPHPLLVDAALNAVYKAKFSPTVLSGSPVQVTGMIVYNFNPGQTFPVVGAGPSDDSSELGAIRQISGGVLNGKALELPRPEYPAAARAVYASGTVTVQVVIDENGLIINAAAVSGHPLLRPAAVEAARNAKFAPTMLQGTPVKISGVITYNFVAPERP
ncbi:MAG: TonB family protein [Blastocatellia bacterium]|nr:TonB family protein [Blastocatellia bacterium]